VFWWWWLLFNFLLKPFAVLAFWAFFLIGAAKYLFCCQVPRAMNLANLAGVPVVSQTIERNTTEGNILIAILIAPT
jgi:hypothetical protein